MKGDGPQELHVDGPRPAVAWVIEVGNRWPLTDAERLVLLLLALDAWNVNDPSSAPGRDALASWSGMNQTRVTDALTSLRVVGGGNGKRRGQRFPGRPALIVAEGSRAGRRVYRLQTSLPVSRDTSGRSTLPVSRDTSGAADDGLGGEVSREVSRDLSREVSREAGHTHPFPSTTHPPPRFASQSHQEEHSANGGAGRSESHPNTDDALGRLGLLMADRLELRQRFTLDELLGVAVDVGALGDPLDGYRRIKAATVETFDGSRDSLGVLRARIRKGC